MAITHWTNRRFIVKAIRCRISEGGIVRARECLGGSERLNGPAKPVLWLAIIMLALSACTKPAPYGQVLAEINGDDVTRRDLAAELQVTGQYGAAPSAVLEQVIERKLLVRAGYDAGIEHSPEYLAAIRRGREQLLAEMYVQRLARQVPVSTRTEIDDYIAAHPFAFTDRAIVDVTRLDVPAVPAARATLNHAVDARAAAAALSAQGVKATLSDQTLDTATLPAAIAASLVRAPVGLVMAPSANGLTAYQVKASRPAPLAGTTAESAAARAIGLQRLTQAISDQINLQRRRARIRYQAGLGPSSS